MRDVSLRRGEIMDPPGKRYWPIFKGRDGCRSPMQWDDTPYAGFSSAKPWLPVHPNYHQRNVAAQNEDTDSLLNFTRKLIALRKEYPALQRGEFVPLLTRPRDALVYLRRTATQTVLVALNFHDRRVCEPLDQNMTGNRWRSLLTARDDSAALLSDNCLELAPHQVCLLVTP